MACSEVKSWENREFCWVNGRKMIRKYKVVSICMLSCRDITSSLNSSSMAGAALLLCNIVTCFLVLNHYILI